MHGGVILFRGTGADARRYVESDRSRADDYYLGAEASVAEFTALDGDGNVTATLGLDPEVYAAWVDWTSPLTGESMGRPRLPGEGRQGSPRFAEMVVNAPKSLSIAAAHDTTIHGACDCTRPSRLVRLVNVLGCAPRSFSGPGSRQQWKSSTIISVSRRPPSISAFLRTHSAIGAAKEKSPSIGIR